VVAQLSIPDMRLPIQYALTYPERVPLGTEAGELDLATCDLRFREPDTKRFPCLDLARSALARGGACTCALNAADEVAVEAFLSGGLRFTEIPRVIRTVLQQTSKTRLNSLADVLECDAEARRRAKEAVQAAVQKARSSRSGE
jgi:1-deoxy-D-xylulose-5-phosphate reductoisomerase